MSSAVPQNIGVNSVGESILVLTECCIGPNVNGR